MRSTSKMKAAGRFIPGLMCAAAAAPGWAQAPSATQPVMAEFQPGGPRFARVRTVPPELLDARSREVVVLPSEPRELGEDWTEQSSGAIGRVTPETRRLPDGYFVVSRLATIEPDGRWLVARFAHAEGLPDAPPLRILPNGRLEMLEAILPSVKDEPRFELTGRVTEFQGENYLLIELLAARSAAPPPAKAPEEPAAANLPDPQAPATQPADDREPTPQEIIQRLMQNKPLKEVALPEQVRVATQPAPEQEADDREGEGRLEAAAGSGPRWLPETVLADRAVRLVPGDTWWTFVFEDLGNDPEVEPVRLLPNRQLEAAIAHSNAGTNATVFVISGEVTVYKGVNYLLLRKVLVRRDLGNFR